MKETKEQSKTIANIQAVSNVSLEGARNILRKAALMVISGHCCKEIALRKLVHYPNIKLKGVHVKALNQMIDNFLTV